MTSVVLKDKYKEHWYALVLSIIQGLSCEEALQTMGIKMPVNGGGPCHYLDLRQKGYSWSQIARMTGCKNPRTIVYKYNKRKLKIKSMYN